MNEAGRMHPAVMMGSSFAVAMGLFAWLGHRWDEKTGREPLGVLLGVGVGFLYGGYEVWKLTRTVDAPKEHKLESSVSKTEAANPQASGEDV